MKSYVQPIIRVNECLLETVFLSGSPQRGILGKANTTGGTTPQLSKRSYFEEVEESNLCGKEDE
ncbi:hypothetical protein [Prevotella veroralis]|jgi:hypothetical protein|uniref:hypothetical protein n=1 Tax=Prevotella veroralis TaxID=28137 RepID=UPI0012DD82EA|nr:hypothetical protein [Prevotella veroralis]QUB40749.1 hypothetical protein J5A55_00290 [Prevotella veroralis]